MLVLMPWYSSWSSLSPSFVVFLSMLMFLEVITIFSLPWREAESCDRTPYEFSRAEML